ncbi:uncharacterized protein LOC141590384 [Silene latifolia]|uniref:uncharacterized protein LOC141590384 n=1 Tax=Silene latifolia TaxID=37657 RepID=UPI003D783B9E
MAKTSMKWRENMPWLLLCENKESRNVFDLSNNKCYKFHIPDSFGKRCYGTGSGWILSVGLDHHIHLFNPITAARLDLPSIHALPHQPRGEDGELPYEDPTIENQLVRDEFIHDALVAPQQDCNDDESSLLVVVIYGLPPYNYIAVAKPGDSKWAHIEPIEGYIHEFAEAAYCPGLGLILFMTYQGTLCFWDLRLNKPLALQPYLPSPVCFPIDYLTTKYYRKFYLVESFGNILAVLRWVDVYVVQLSEDRFVDGMGNSVSYFDKLGYNTSYFEVYKLDIHANKWIEMDDLEDLALFVGNSPASSVTASSFKGCQGNSIYYTDDSGFEETWKCTVDELGGRDMGVYNFPEQTTLPFYSGDDSLSSYSVPLWFHPQIN